MIMNQIGCLISFITVLTSVIYYLRYREKRTYRKLDDKEGDNIIKNNFASTAVIIFLIVLFALINIYLCLDGKPNEDGTLDLIILYLMSYLLFFSMLLHSINWKLELLEDYCIRTNLIRRKKKYFYKDLRIVKISDGFKVYQNKHRVFTIYYQFDNYEKFEELYIKEKEIYSENKI